MSFLLDPCVISELTRASPSPGVLDWFAATPADLLHFSVLSLGEIRKGVERLPARARHDRIAAWLETELPAWFEDRVLPIDAAVADQWGRMIGRVGQPLLVIDALIAATAWRHRLTVITRNVQDFARTGVPSVDPWTVSERKDR